MLFGIRKRLLFIDVIKKAAYARLEVWNIRHTLLDIGANLHALEVDNFEGHQTILVLVNKHRGVPNNTISPLIQICPFANFDQFSLNGNYRTSGPL